MHPTHLLALVLALTWIPAVLSAQDGSSPPAPSMPRLSLTVYLGGSGGGPAGDLESSMRANGYTDPFGGCDFFCVDESPSPSSYSSANPFMLSVRYRLRAPFAAELLFGQSAAGGVDGNRGAEFLGVEYRGTIVAPIASVGTRRFRAGIGPALLRSRWDYGTFSGSGNEERVTTTSLGAVGNLAFMIPLGRHLHLDLTGQYRWFGRTELRPPRWSSTDRAAKVSSTHEYFGAGIGWTF